jgi:hypothetical protein
MSTSEQKTKAPTLHVHKEQKKRLMCGSCVQEFLLIAFISTYGGSLYYLLELKVETSPLSTHNQDASSRWSIEDDVRTRLSRSCSRVCAAVVCSFGVCGRKSASWPVDSCSVKV